MLISSTHLSYVQISKITTSEDGQILNQESALDIMQMCGVTTPLTVSVYNCAVHSHSDRMFILISDWNKTECCTKYSSLSKAVSLQVSP